MKWNTRTLTFLAEMLKQNGAPKHKEMPEDMALRRLMPLVGPRP